MANNVNNSNQNVNIKTPDNTMMYVGIAVFVLFLLLGGGGYWYTGKNTVEEKSAADAKAKADKSANAAAVAATKAASAVAKAAEDAEEAAVASTAAAAAAAATAATAAESLADAKLLCKSKLNTYTYNGNQLICPPQFNFGEQIRYDKDVYNMWEAKDVCWMAKDRDNCFGNSCDPRKYMLNGKTYPVSTLGDPKGYGITTDSYSGLLRPTKYTSMTNPLYMVSGVPYDDDTYCPS
jgi:hypothetical protein